MTYLDFIAYSTVQFALDVYIMYMYEFILFLCRFYSDLELQTHFRETELVQSIDP